jgi:hypothetical protein
MTSLAQFVAKAYRIGEMFARDGHPRTACPYHAPACVDAWAQGYDAETHRLAAIQARCSGPAEIAAYAADRGALYQILWRDEDERLVAPILAATCTLVKRGSHGVASVTVPAGEADELLRRRA